MGMFDIVSILDKENAAQVCCAAGHPQFKKELQTKDFSNNLDRYFIFNNNLFLEGKLENYDNLEVKSENNDILLVKTYSAKRVVINETIEVYNYCYDCDPVIIVLETSWRGAVGERWLFNRWELVFDDGRLVKTIPIEIPTREELKAEILAGGCTTVLDDDDKLAKKHLEHLRKK